MVDVDTARYELETRAEVTVNYLRLFLVVIFSVAVTLSYLNRQMLLENIPYFVVGICCFLSQLNETNSGR